MAGSRRHEVRRTALAVALALACGSCQQGGAVVASTSSGGASSSGSGASTGSAGSTGATGDASGGSASTGGGTTHHGGGGSSSTGGGSESGTTGDPGTPPAPARWVLYDADEVAVDAVVAPSCVDPALCNLPEPGHQGAVSPQCVRVIWHEGSYVDLRYGSATGLLGDCRTTPLWDAEHPPGAFPGADCAPPAYFPAGEGTSSASRWERGIKAFADGHFEYESRDTPAMGFYPANSWLGNECVVNILLSGGTPWLPVPDWAVGLLPNPPYSLRWEPWE